VRLPTITGLDCGWLVTQQRTLVDGGSTDELRIPIPAWLVRHEHGDVVFDTGLHPSLADGQEELGGMRKYFRAELPVGGSVGGRLTEHDVDPSGPLTVVVSHTHFDHVGGLCDLPNARMIVHVDEWAAAMDDRQPNVDRHLFDLGHDVLTVTGAYDVYGDGSVVTLPTPGHTCGHQSLKVQTDDGPVVLAADACYFSNTLDDEVLPPISFDAQQQLRSLALLRAERNRGARIVPGHDAEVFATMVG
jgi:glyoxylase-like metal-dependent hydrolase (beta-lactamase superfamily II)